MKREQIIEAMARALVERNHDLYGVKLEDYEPYEWAELLDLAASPLTALEAAIPGLADVISGKAAIVPVEPTSAMKEHAALQVMMTDWADLDPEEQAGLCHIYSAMIEARPK